MKNKLYLNAGQMKAGTSFLCNILFGHPEIYFTPEKELHFLSQHYGRFKILWNSIRLRKAQSLLQEQQPDASRLHEYQYLLRWVADYLEEPNDISWYENMFKGIKGHQYAADFSNLTCTIPAEGLTEIKALFPNAKITYCVRNPVSRAFSHMKFHRQFAGQEGLLENMDDQSIKELMLSDDIMPQSKTAEHLNNLVDVFGEQNIRVIRCENMWSEPQVTVDAICDFLEIDKFHVKENLLRPENVGPSEKMNDRIRGLIEETMSDEIHKTEGCLQKYSNLIVV